MNPSMHLLLCCSKSRRTAACASARDSLFGHGNDRLRRWLPSIGHQREGLAPSLLFRSSHAQITMLASRSISPPSGAKERLLWHLIITLSTLRLLLPAAMAVAGRDNSRMKSRMLTMLTLAPATTPPSRLGTANPRERIVAMWIGATGGTRSGGAAVVGAGATIWYLHPRSPKAHSSPQARLGGGAQQQTQSHRAQVTCTAAGRDDGGVCHIISNHFEKAGCMIGRRAPIFSTCTYQSISHLQSSLLLAVSATVVMRCRPV